jgi:hypothetical protein
MTKCLVFAFFALVTLVASPANPETSGTNLAMTAHWDNGKAIRGTVTLVKGNLSKADTIIVAKPLSSEGQVYVTVPLAVNAVYKITVLETDGKELLEFPITTAMINPNNLVSAGINIVCREKDHSVASARINVLMKF